MPTVRVAALVLAFAFANASTAALFDDNEARRRIADTNVRLGEIQTAIEHRLAEVERQLKSGGLMDLASQIDLVRGDLAKMRGQSEVLAHEIAEAQKRQRDLYVDLDTRMRRLESAQAAAAAAAERAAAQPPQPAQPPVADAGAPSSVGGGTTVATAPPTSPPPGGLAPLPQSGTVPAVPPSRPADPVAEQRAYDAALDLFKRGDYSGAITAFGNFVRAYPRTPLSSSAQYWIGNAHFARRDYRSAITAQRTLIANYPDSAKVPDALLNIASAQSELGDAPGARRTLEEIVARHPQSEAAPKARQRLAGR
ncbi:MAG TPA: tol-pal system protein YbgF [Casimicrobiaceae bacterium]|nr:tol-pal system protein YbgF [Casimicrobiaceae bacterium]